MLRNFFAGFHAVKEYAPVAISGEVVEHAYLSVNGLIFDVSISHWLLGLSPIVFGVAIQEGEAFTDCRKFLLYFTCDPCPLDLLSYDAAERFIKKKSLVSLELERFGILEEGDGILLLLQLSHTHINYLNPILVRWYYHRYYKKQDMPFAKFLSYLAAFSFPRRVRLISFRSDDYYNIFPMDLVGEVGWGNHWVFGLRHSNLALAGIMRSKRIIVAEVPWWKKDALYDLGRHHSSAAPPPESLPFPVFKSPGWGFYLPYWALSYKEIVINQTVDVGSHMVLWGEQLREVILQQDAPHLHHIHFLHWLYRHRTGSSYVPA